jgi:hypothetical protein
MAISTKQLAESTSDKPPPRSRWIPLSVRLFAAVLLLQAIVGILWTGVPAFRRYVAICEIERVGGRIGFYRGGPEWLRELLGDELMRCFDEVEYIHFRPGPDDYLRDPRGLRRRELPYSLGPTVDDVTLAYLPRFPELKSLDLRWAKISDAGVVHLSKLRGLNYLRLEDTDVSDASAPVLARLHTLEHLNVSHTRLTADGLARLAGHRKLRTIVIDETQVGPASIASLGAMPGVQYVWLAEVVDYYSYVALRKSLTRALAGVTIQ